MSNLYVCKEYENIYSEGFKIVRPLEEHEKVIRENTVEDLLQWMSYKSWISAKAPSPEEIQAMYLEEFEEQ